MTLTKKTYKFILLLLLFKQTSFKLALRKRFSPTPHLQKCSRSSLTSHLRRWYSPVTFLNPIGQPTGFVRESVYWYLTASNAESNWLKIHAANDRHLKTQFDSARRAAEPIRSRRGLSAAAALIQTIEMKFRVRP